MKLYLLNNDTQDPSWRWFRTRKEATLAYRDAVRAIWDNKETKAHAVIYLDEYVVSRHLNNGGLALALLNEEGWAETVKTIHGKKPMS